MACQSLCRSVAPPLIGLPDHLLTILKTHPTHHVIRAHCLICSAADNLARVLRIMPQNQLSLSHHTAQP